MSKQLRILVVCCTQKMGEEVHNTPLAKSLKKCQNIMHMYYEGNTYSLPSMYNKQINESHYNNVDYVVFAHDDLSIEDNDLQGKLYKAMEQFDVVGLAGTKNVVVKKPALWHLMNNDQPFAGASGAVAHPVQGRDSVAMSAFGPTPDRVILLDGVLY